VEERVFQAENSVDEDLAIKKRVGFRELKV
jgi:hypothetical protein